MIERIALMGLVGLAFCSNAAAAAPGSAQAEVIERLGKCRAIADTAARAICYDAGFDSLKKAQTAGDVVVYDRSQLRETRRSGFGLPQPKVKIPGSRGKDRQDDVKEILSKIAQVNTDTEGRLMFVLEDGARWRQTDTLTLGRRPLPGQPVRIRAAALGSYLMNVDGQKALRVRRER